MQVFENLHLITCTSTLLRSACFRMREGNSAGREPGVQGLKGSEDILVHARTRLLGSPFSQGAVPPVTTNFKCARDFMGAGAQLYMCVRDRGFLSRSIRSVDSAVKPVKQYLLLYNYWISIVYAIIHVDVYLFFY